MFQLALPLNSENELGVLVVSDVALDRSDANAGYIYVPAVDVVSFRECVHNAPVDGVAIYNFDFRKLDALFEPGRGGNAGNHHQLNQLLRLDGQLPPLRFLQTVFGGGNLLRGKRFEKDLEPVLPKLLLLSLVEKREIANMVDKDVSQNRQLGFLGRHFALFRLERRTEALQGRGGIELADLPLDLICDELPLQVYPVRYLVSSSSISTRKASGKGKKHQETYSAPVFPSAHCCLMRVRRLSHWREWAEKQQRRYRAVPVRQLSWPRSNMAPKEGDRRRRIGATRG